MRLGLAYNQKPHTGLTHRDVTSPSSHCPPLDDEFAEWDEPSTIAAVENALRPYGDVVRLEAGDEFTSRLASARVDLLFNMAEGLAGPNREAHVPAVAETLGIPYTASDPLTLAIALHKARTKELFAARGVPTAPFCLVEGEDDLLRLHHEVPYPVFLKPAWEGSSKGIAEASYVDTPDAAADRARHLLETYQQPVLVESYLPGEEFTVAVLGTGADARPLPLVRFRFEALPSEALPIMGYEAKWVWDDPAAPLDVLECPADVPDDVAGPVREAALAAYRVLGCRDWGRVDVRLDASGRPHVLEVNPLPGVIPDPADNSCFPRAAAAAGLTYDELIQTVVRSAWHRATGRELPAPTVPVGA